MQRVRALRQPYSLNLADALQMVWLKGSAYALRHCLSSASCHIAQQVNAFARGCAFGATEYAILLHYWARRAAVRAIAMTGPTP